MQAQMTLALFLLCVGCNPKVDQVPDSSPKAPAVPKAQYPQPKTSEALIQAVMDGLAKKDADALRFLKHTADEMKSLCPLVQVDPAEAAELDGAIERCLALGDFQGAKIILTEGGENRVPVDGCGKLMRLKDIDLTVLLGDKKVLVRLDNPLNLSGEEVYIGGLFCQVAQD